MIRMTRYSGAAMVALLAILVVVHGQPTLHLQHEDGRVGIRKLGGVLLGESPDCEPSRPPDGVFPVEAGDFDGDGASDPVFEAKAESLLVRHMDQENRSAFG